MRSKVTAARRKVYTVLRQNRKSLTILPRNAGLVALQPAGERLPFFVVDSFENFIDVVQLIGTNQPVLCLIPQEEMYSRRHRDAHTLMSGEYDIHDEAAAHVKTILAYQPNGPYMIGGFCAPGIVAYQIAQQLQAHGDEVGLLVLFDTANPYSKAWRLRAFMHSYSTFQPRLARLLAGLKGHLDKAPKWDFFKRKSSLLQRARREDSDRVFAPCVAVITKYRPTQYRGRVLLVLRRQGIIRKFLIPNLGWGEVVRGKIETCLVNAAAHVEIFKSELDRALVAQKLRKCIDEVVKAPSL
jgi:thioesterase domain-containing protein